MMPSMLLYLGGMLVMFVAQRLFVDHSLQTPLTIVAAVALAASAALGVRALRAAKDDGLRFAHRVTLIFLLVGVASLVMYAATTDSVVRSMTLAEDAEKRWLGVWRSLWPLLWLLGTIPMLVVGYACESSPVMMPRRRVRDLTIHGLVAAIGIALIFPVNYIASQEKERWDLAYFKTPTPGTATVAVAQSLESEVNVRIFMPPSSEVAGELVNYFALLEGPNLTVEVIDQAAEPRLAKALAVRDNGVIAFTVGEVDLDPTPAPPPAEGEEAPPEKPKPITRTHRINPEFDKAKRELKKIDGEVQKILIELGHGERVAYFTTGHGELDWKSKGVLDRQSKGFRDTLKLNGFSVKPLGIRQGLAEAVPDDADLVIIAGAQYPFQPLEVQAVRAYLESGGSLLVALEPVSTRPPQIQALGDPLLDMVEEVMGLKLEPGVLADERNHLPLFNNAQDRLLIATDGFSSHASNRTLASEKAALFTPISGHLTETEQHDSGIAITVRSLATTWADLDGDAEYDAEEGESKTTRNLAAAVTGGVGATGWRAVVTADASMFSDWSLGNEKVPAGTMRGVGYRGNQLFARDVSNWLVGAEALSGTTENEEDVKIEHTKDNQVWWFYLTVLGVPLGVFLLGALRVRLRRVNRASTGGDR